MFFVCLETSSSYHYVFNWISLQSPIFNMAQLDILYIHITALFIIQIEAKEYNNN